MQPRGRKYLNNTVLLLTAVLLLLITSSNFILANGSDNTSVAHTEKFSNPLHKLRVSKDSEDFHHQNIFTEIEETEESEDDHHDFQVQPDFNLALVQILCVRNAVDSKSSALYKNQPTLFSNHLFLKNRILLI